MFERLLLTLLIIIVAAALAWVWQQVARRRIATLTAGLRQPTVLYFRSDHCVPCTAQAQILGEVANRHNVAVETVDVEREPERAQQFNIMTLPTTIVVGETGVVNHINYGLTQAGKLLRQLEINA